MSERPILMNSEMVRATLDGRKTQTRRVVKPQPPASHCPQWGCVGGEGFGFWFEDRNTNQRTEMIRCPYGVPGDRLWVREAHAVKRDNMENFGDIYPGPVGDAWDEAHQCVHWGMEIVYRADGVQAGMNRTYKDGSHPHWRPSIHMPRWACRLVLEVTSVRVERVQDITEEDALAEGVDPLQSGHPIRGAFTDGARGAFAQLWEDINAKRGFGWDENNLVWVIGFKPVSP